MDAKQGRGGAGRGQGRIGSMNPLRLITLDTYPEAQQQLAAITHYHRRTGQPRISQPAVVAALIAAEYERLGLAPRIEIGHSRVERDDFESRFPISEFTAVRFLRSGTVHYGGSGGRAYCGAALPDDREWLKDTAPKITCRRCLAQRGK